ncbi:hypothetical protein CVIRNUC_005375 [Coccomyxa viridis]|uniref:30S ribosomal protein 3, chloroplastic n=1 Tax=Coccomyxa viridis TaxID=1274662 RepID=A0AAV1I625_9CHLO|nr:hypothetical protein CVIRNUC_005375 [Coccomyxa viridis]
MATNRIALQARPGTLVAARCHHRPQPTALALPVRKLVSRRTSWVASAASVEETEASQLAVEEGLPAEAPAAAEPAAAEPASAAEESPASSSTAPENAGSFALSFLWLEKDVAVAVDQTFGEKLRSPLTEYFFWPRKDAWEELKSALEAKPWVSERDKVLLLNKTTEVINFWQDEEKKHSLEEAQAQFPDCKFQGA